MFTHLNTKPTQGQQDYKDDIRLYNLKLKQGRMSTDTTVLRAPATYS